MSERPFAPFRVRYCSAHAGWDLWASAQVHFIKTFPTQGEAIDYAYKNWPRWP